MATLNVREMIERLVAVPSVSAVDPTLDTGNREVCVRLAEWLEHEGWTVEWMDLPGTDGRKTNLVARRGEGDGGLVLSGHTDTVPYDAGKWSSDPFRATERDGRLYGLGTSDMKSFLALALEAARAFSDRELREPLYLIGTADEETGMAGARRLLETGKPKARRAIIGEPTGLTPIRMHKGCAMERLEIVGRSGHSSDPSLGASALDGMLDALNAMNALRGELAANHRHDELHPGIPTLNLGRIQGGDNPNRICASCVLDYDVRILPGMSIDAVRHEIRARIDRAVGARSGLAARHVALTTPVEPYETAADAELVRAAEEWTGKRAGGVSFGTEAPFLVELGMETIVLGAGDIAVAHQPDEYLPLDRVDPMIEILRKAIARFCTDA